MEIVGFASEHIDGAAELLAARYRREREREPAMPARFEDCGEAQAGLRASWEKSGAEGVAAVEDGRVVGFLLGIIERPQPLSVRSLMDSPRAGHIIDHAVALEDGEEIYRSMYAAFAPRWLASGVFDHNIGIAASDHEALDAWFSLGFGQRSAHAMRDTSAINVSADGLAIRRAVAADVDTVFGFARGLFRHMAGPPSFEPYLPEAEPDVRREVERWLAGSDTAIWLAEREGSPVGTIVLWRGMPRKVAPAPSLWLTDAFVEPSERGRGTGLALLAAGMDWARSEGYDWCLLNFLTTNLPAARFWTRTAGFHPITHFLRRWIDERIAWTYPRPS